MLHWVLVIVEFGNMNVKTPNERAPAAGGTESDYALLHGMLRSFTTLARTLNLSHAVNELGSTRQTLRRHIDLLEAAKGEPLFRVEERRYILAPAGQRALPDALDILARGGAWLAGGLRERDGLQWLHEILPDGAGYWQQQRPLGDMWLSERVLCRHAAQAWGASEGAIEHDAFARIRRYGMVFRKHGEEWICVEIGEDSAFAEWFGQTAARSSLGLSIDQMPLRDGFARMLMVPYAATFEGQSIRVDHVCTYQPRELGGQLIPISYQRLLLGMRLADDTPVVVAVIDRCHDVNIDGLNPQFSARMADKHVMEIDPALI